MATLYFKVSSDYDEVIRLRQECEKLEAQLKKMDVSPAKEDGCKQIPGCSQGFRNTTGIHSSTDDGIGDRSSKSWRRNGE